jgi:DNA-binding MarR family transcriptional regulator
MTPSASDAASSGITPELSTVDALAQFSFLIQGTLERRAGEQEVSVIQTRLLGVLRDRRPTMNELAKLLDLDKSSVTGLVDRAERRGLVERTRSASDRRAVLVDLTDGGRALVTEVAALFETDMAMLLHELPASDRAALAQLVTQVLVTHAKSHGVDLFGSATKSGTVRGAGRPTKSTSKN